MRLIIVGMEKQILISVDGNIGSGKSTLLQYIKTHIPEIHIIEEPISQWEEYKNKDGKNLLELFYEDKERWAYTFQNCAVLTRSMNILKTMKENPTKKIFITERSILTDKYVFAKMLYESGCIGDLELSLYNNWYQMMAENIRVDAIIYINTCFDVLLNRIEKRSRRGENKIDTEYLRNLDNQHRMFIEKMEDEYKIPILSLSMDDNVDMENNIKHITEMISCVSYYA